MALDHTRREDTPRRSVSFTARIIADHGQSVCIIVERSRQGAKISINPDLDLATDLSLEIQPGYFVRGTVRWRRQGQAGLRLHLSAAALE